MRRIRDSLKFVVKAGFLLAILILGWVFVNIMSLWKGKQVSRLSEQDDHKLFGPQSARADASAAGTGAGSTPHVAYFDGKRFRIENDFLFGKPKSFFVNYNLIKLLYEQGRIGPDLMKFTHPLKKRKGKLALQLQEIEEEETFVDRLELIRVVHPKNTEVVVNSNFTSYLVVNRKEAEKKIVLPARAMLNNKTDVKYRFADKAKLWRKPGRSGKLYQKGDRLEFSFAGLKPGIPAHLVVKSQFRDWMMGEELTPRISWQEFSFRKLLHRPAVVRTATAGMGLLYLIFGKEILGTAFTSLPIIIGTAASSSCGAGGCTNDCKSIIFSYKNKGNRYSRFLVHEPRDWREGTEVISLPKEAVMPDGTLSLQADFTKRHRLTLAGVWQEMKQEPHRQELLPVETARHSRLGDIRQTFSTDKSYAHMLPGDKIDLEFGDLQIQAQLGEQETYLMQSFGFYTALRPEFQNEISGWENRMSYEARTHYRKLRELNNYF